MTRLARQGQERREGYQEYDLRGDGCEITRGMDPWED